MELAEADLVLTSERLRLRPFALEDVDIATELLCDPKVMRYLDGACEPEQIRSEMPLYCRRGAGGRIGIWCVTRRDTGEKIGDGVLLPMPIEAPDTEWHRIAADSYPDGPVEVGYVLKPSAWGQGFATEICTRLMRFAFENTTLDPVVACTDPDNLNSQAVLLKCGMRRRGTGRAYAGDVPLFEMTRAQWLARA